MIRILPFFIFTIGIFVFTACGAAYKPYQCTHIKYSKVCDKGKTGKYLSRHSKYRTEYFIHYDDSILQLNKVQIGTGEQPYVITGEVSKVDEVYKTAYDNLLVNAPSSKMSRFVLESEFSSDSDQSHLFVKGPIPNDSIPLKLSKDQIYDYHIYTVAGNHMRDDKKVLLLFAIITPIVLLIGAIIVLVKMTA